MIASVRGIFILMVVPSPRRLSMSTVPPIFSTLVRTTSMPTPLPEKCVTRSAVENPGRNTRLTSSRSTSRSACSGVMSLARIAFSRTRWGSIPLPSSAISMMTLPPSWKACRETRPSAGLPLSTRSSGVSMPWSMAFRRRWVSGSRIASMMVLSSSVSRPSISMLALLPQATARSRTTRGNLFQMLPMGCIRVFMTLACSSVVSRFSLCTVPRKGASSWEALNCMT